jgi:hypothetical protein
MKDLVILTYTNVKAASNPVLLELPIIIPILLSTIVSQLNPDGDAEKRFRSANRELTDLQYDRNVVCNDRYSSFCGNKNKGGDVIAFDLPPSAVENQTQSTANITK